MNILITGANGFIGKNLVLELQNRGYTKILKWNRNSSEIDIDMYTRECDFVVHLAGENRPKNVEDFEKGNVELTKKLLQKLKTVTKSLKLKKIIDLNCFKTKV